MPGMHTERARPGVRGALTLRLGWLLALVGAALLATLAWLPLSPAAQATTGAAAMAMAWLLTRSGDRAATLAILALSVAITARYLIWRACDTLDGLDWPATALGGGLLLAEGYAAAMGMLVALVAVWPLGRAPASLPGDPAAWPGVDVAIGSRDAPLDVLRRTVLAVLALEWPADRLTVYLLDDAGRDDIRQLAAETGTVWLAFNLAAVLDYGSGDHVAVFDAATAPAPAFLRRTIGWLMAEPRLALVQTSLRGADEDERSGPWQDGADAWGAAQYAGSGAVLRRAALQRIGGFATETAAEDTHTTLRLHRAGWDSAFLPLALALAESPGPASLSAATRQARRRVRGLLHILRRFHPLTGRGLTLAQRLCYAHACGHALFALPWLALLTAPSAVLLTGDGLIAAPMPALLAYGVPHLLLGLIVAARCQGGARRVFRRQVRRTVLAPHLVPTTLAALAWPRRGRPPTAPTRAAGRFDWRAAAPNMALAALLAGSVARGVRDLATSAAGASALALYTLWAGGSLLLVLAAVAKAWRPRGAAAAALALTLFAMPALAQPSPGGMTVRVIPQTVSPLPMPLPFPLRTAPISEAPRVAPPTAEPRPLAEPAPTPAISPTSPPAQRRAAYSLRHLGAAGRLALGGATPEQAVTFGVRADEVVVGAQLALSGALSLDLLPAASGLTVSLNGQPVGAVPAGHDPGGFRRDIPLNPVLFAEHNRLAFRFAGRIAAECDEPLDPRAWAAIDDTTTLTLTLERLPAQRELSRLPRPFFDPAQSDRLSLPFVLPATPGNDALRAAGIAASWLGWQAGGRGAHFPVLDSPPALGDAVVLTVGGAGVVGLRALAGPTLAVLPNPNDRLGSLLVIGGRDGEEAVAAATALAFGGPALGGAVATVQAPAVAPRRPYDAPAWIGTARPARLGELASPEALRSTGHAGRIAIPFRAAPDLTTWRDRPFALALGVRAPGPPLLDPAVSRLDVAINGRYLASVPLGQPGLAPVALPVSALAGANLLEFSFDARPPRRAACAGMAGEPPVSIDPDSTIDLSGGLTGSRHFAEMPDLAAFAGSLFPFTRLADLSQTAVVLPDQPSGAELGAYLDLMGRLGAVTGLPGSRVAVARPGGVAALADRDLLLIGAPGRLRAAGDLLRWSGVRLADGRLGLSLSDPFDGVRRVFDPAFGAGRDRVAVILAAPDSGALAVLAGGQSPLRPGRSVVALLAEAPEALAAAVASLSDPARMKLIGGDLALLSGGQVTSYRVAAPYTIGSLPAWMWPDWYLRGSAPGAVGLLLLGGAALAAGGYVLLSRRADRRLASRRSTE